MGLRKSGSRPTKSRAASCGRSRRTPTSMRLRSTVTKTKSACSISFASPRVLIRWWWARVRFLARRKRPTKQRAHHARLAHILHRLFQRAFRVAKQVRTHTDITRGLVSVGSVAVDLAQRIFGQLSDCKVLVLGAGETSERTARALASRGVKDLRVSNRSSDPAHELARLVGGLRHSVR